MIKRNQMIKTVILCCDGDSSDPDTWSNIPFMLESSLRSKGINIVRVDLSPNPIAKFMWRYSVGVIH